MAAARRPDVSYKPGTPMKRSLVSMMALVAVSCRAGIERPAHEAAEWIEPTTGMVFVSIPAGRFVMGSPTSEVGRDGQERQHEVTISRPFYLGKFEVTQGQWRTVVGANPSWFPGEPDLPVERVNWFEVQDFLKRLTSMSRDSRFRLPSEAEWEFACRAGKSTAYPSGSELTTAQANFDGRRSAAGPPGADYRGRTTRVGLFPPNGWGLHDMSGNVWEWTGDRHCEYPSGPVVDPVGQCDEPLKVIRGGSWYFGADSARCAVRYTHQPNDRGFSLGVRVVRESISRT